MDADGGSMTLGESGSKRVAFCEGQTVAEQAEFNRSKFKELVLYLSQRSAGDEGFGAVKLNKLLYRSDFEAYRLLGRPITGETYIKQEFGPVAADLPIVL